jgi:hypothetical protein
MKIETIIENGQEYQVFTWTNGDKEYYQNSYLNRIDGPAIERTNGNKLYYQGGLLHRLGGPASEWPSGYKIYYLYGKCHRLDGPAVIWPDGREEYWIKGIRYTKQDFEDFIFQLMYCELDNLMSKEKNK